MATQPFTGSPAYVESIRGLLRLHELTENGQDESPEADAIRDSLERPWRDLSDVEKERITGLSEDLYAISDPVTARLPKSPDAEQGRLDAIAASQAGDPDSALVLLRRWAKHLDPASLSFERGCVWEEAGDSATATPFFEHAAKLDPGHGSVLYMYLSSLRKSRPIAALSKSRQIVSEPELHPLLGIAGAAEILADSTLRMPEDDARPVLRQLIQALKDALNRVQTSGVKEHPLSVHTHANIMLSLGFCYFRTGDHLAALDHYNRGLSLDPDNESLLIARGTLLYGRDPLTIDDFEQAARRGSKSVWPYFFLAHHHLLGKRFAECRQMCEQALSRPAQDEVKAHLNEWRAISNAELGSPRELVHDEFETAIQLAQNAERIRRNLEEFESVSAERGNLPLPWVEPTKSEINAVGQAFFSTIAA